MSDNLNRPDEIFILMAIEQIVYDSLNAKNYREKYGRYGFNALIDAAIKIEKSIATNEIALNNRLNSWQNAKIQ